jgi:hypothetical protein
VNSLKGYTVTITSNLSTPLFDDIGSFCSSIENKSAVRLNVSFHPSLIDTDSFCGKVLEMRGRGVIVGDVVCVDYPTSNFKRHYNEFIARGIHLQPQTFLGKIDDTLYPNKYAVCYKEHGIDDFKFYEERSSCKEGKKVVCSTNKLIFSPTGGVHRCHYHLYSNKESITTIQELSEHSGNNINFSLGYSECTDFGFCNPCDFNDTQIKSEAINLLALITQYSNEECAQHIITALLAYSKFDEAVLQFVQLLVSTLYTSNNPYWELYNNEDLIREINDFIRDDSEIDNTRALLLSTLELNIFRVLGGVNVYRILDPVNLCKYIEAITVKFKEAFAHELEQNSDVFFQRLSVYFGSLASMLYKMPTAGLMIGDDDEFLNYV